VFADLHSEDISQRSSPSDMSVVVPVAVGVTVGAVLVIVAIIVVICCCRRRNNEKHLKSSRTGTLNVRFIHNAFLPSILGVRRRSGLRQIAPILLMAAKVARRRLNMSTRASM